MMGCLILSCLGRGFRVFSVCLFSVRVYILGKGKGWRDGGTVGV